MKWTLHGIEFPTSAAVAIHLRNMLARYPDYGRLEPDDEALVRDLLKHHPNYPEVVGPGIAWIYVYYIPNTPWRRFHVHHTDGTPRDFAWSHCLDGKRNPARALGRVLRHLIQPQTMDFRALRYQSGEGWICELCGDLILYSHDAHVDHIPPWTFERQMKDWLEMKGLDPAAIRIVASTEYEGHSRLADRELAESWIDYHRGHALLRMLCLPCHKTVTRQNHPKKPKGEGENHVDYD